MANYDVEGYLLEACSCAPPCPCWIGDDADGGKCDAFNGYRIQKGSIRCADRVSTREGEGDDQGRHKDRGRAEMAPYTDRDGRPTTLVNTVFSNIAGSPAYVAKATSHRVNIPEHGMQWSFQNRNAIQESFRFVG